MKKSGSPSSILILQNVKVLRAEKERYEGLTRIRCVAGHYVTQHPASYNKLTKILYSEISKPLTDKVAGQPLLAN